MPDAPKSRARICVNAHLRGSSSPAVPNLFADVPVELGPSRNGCRAATSAYEPIEEVRLEMLARETRASVCYLLSRPCDLAEVGRLAAAYVGCRKRTPRTFLSAVAG